MGCLFDRNIIQKYVDNTIEPLELIVLREHIKVCQDCKFELELMSKLENSMYEYFEGIPQNGKLDDFSLGVLNQCFEGSRSYSFRDGVAKAWEINKAVVGNAVRYTSYLPGSRLAANTAKKVGNSLNKAVKSYAKNSFKKLIANAVK